MTTKIIFKTGGEPILQYIIEKAFEAGIETGARGIRKYMKETYGAKYMIDRDGYPKSVTFYDEQQLMLFLLKADHG